MRVLVIDDDDIARESMVARLEMEGHDVHELSSPIGTTSAILEHAIEVVVLDVMMPTMRGDKLAALLRGNPRLEGLGVVLVSGAAEHELISIASRVRADAVVGKSELHRRLAEAVMQAGRRRATMQT